MERMVDRGACTGGTSIYTNCSTGYRVLYSMGIQMGVTVMFFRLPVDIIMENGKGISFFHQYGGCFEK